MAAPIAALALCGVLAGTALAQEDARACEVVRSELAAAEVAATLPVTVDGVTFPSLAAVQSALAGLPADVEAVAPLRARLQAIVDAAAKVDLLKQEATTCVEAPDPTVEPTPDPTAEPTATSVVPPPVASSPTTTSDVASADGDVADSVPQGSIDTGAW